MTPSTASPYSSKPTGSYHDPYPLSESDNVACQMFLMCDRAASGSYDHPVLGPILGCRRCARVLEIDLQEAEITIAEVTDELGAV